MVLDSDCRGVRRTGRRACERGDARVRLAAATTAERGPSVRQAKSQLASRASRRRSGRESGAVRALGRCGSRRVRGRCRWQTCCVGGSSWRIANDIRTGRRSCRGRAAGRARCRHRHAGSRPPGLPGRSVPALGITKGQRLSRPARAHSRGADPAEACSAALGAEPAERPNDLGAGVRLVVHRPQPRNRHMGVELGRGHARVAQ